MEDALAVSLSILAVAGALASFLKTRAQTISIRQEAEKSSQEAEYTKSQAIAEASKTVAAAADATIKNLVHPLNERIDQLEAAMEALNGKYMKLQIAYVIACQLMEAAGIQPVITLDDLAQMSARDLRAIAEKNGVRWQR